MLTLQTKRIVSIMFLGVLFGVFVLGTTSYPLTNGTSLNNSQSNKNGLEYTNPNLQAPGGVTVDHLDNVTFIEGDMNMTIQFTPHLDGSVTEDYYEIWDITTSPILLASDAYINNSLVEYNLAGYPAGNYTFEARFYTYENVNGTAITDVFIISKPQVDVVGPGYLSFQEGDYMELYFTPYLFGALTPDYFEIVDVTDYQNETLLYMDNLYYNESTVYYVLSDYYAGSYIIQGRFFTFEGEMGYWNITVDIFPYDDRFVDVEQPYGLTFYENETYLLYWTPFLYGNLTPYWYEIVEISGIEIPLYNNNSYVNGTTVYYELNGSNYSSGIYNIEARFYTYENITGFCSIMVNITNQAFVEVIQPDYLIFTDTDTKILTWTPILHGPLTPTNYSIIDVNNGSFLVVDVPYSSGIEVSYLLDGYGPGYYEFGAYFYTLEGKIGYCSIYVDIYDTSSYIEILQPDQLTFYENETILLSWTPILYGEIYELDYVISNALNESEILFYGETYQNNTPVDFILEGYGPGDYFIQCEFYADNGGYFAGESGGETFSTGTGQESSIIFNSCVIEVIILPIDTYIEVIQPEYLNFTYGEQVELRWIPILYGSLTPDYYEIIDIWGNNTVLQSSSPYYNNTPVIFMMDTWSPGYYNIGARFYTYEGIEGFCSINVEIFPNETQDLYVEVVQPDYLSFIEGTNYDLVWTPILHGRLTPTSYEIVDVWKNTVLFVGESYLNNTDIYFTLNSSYGPGNYSIGAHFYTVEGYEGFCSILIEIFPAIQNDWIEIIQPDSLTFYDNETIILQWIPILHGYLVPYDYYIIDVNAGGNDLFHGASYMNNTPISFDMSGWLPGTYMIGAEFWAFTDYGEGELINGFCSIEVIILDSGSSGGSDIYIDQPDIVTIYEGDNVELNWTITLIYLSPDYYDIYDEDTGTALIQHGSYNNGSTIQYNVSSYNVGTYHIGIRVYTIEGMTAQCKIELRVLSLSDIDIQYMDSFTVNYSQPLEVWFVATIPSGFAPLSWELLQDGSVLANGSFESGIETRINVTDFLLHVGTYQFDLIVYGVDSAGQVIQAQVNITVNVVMEGDGGESPFGDLLNNIPGYPSYIVIGIAVVSILTIIKRIRKYRK
ncbi:hypothetical protein [Candidatus Harpocratesius sp.]